MVVIADSKKLVARLGAFPLPIEVVPFGLAATRRHIERAFGELGLAGPIRLRGGSSPFVTDGGHYILDCSLGAIAEPERLSQNFVANSRGRRTRAVHRPCARRDHRRGRRCRTPRRHQLKIESHLQESFMPARAGIAKGRLALFLFIALSVSARAAGTTPTCRFCAGSPHGCGSCARSAVARPLAAADTILGDHRRQAVDRDRRSGHDGGARSTTSPRLGPRSGTACARP